MRTPGLRRLRGEDGVTLVEMLSAMVVSGVVLAFVTGAVVNAMRSERRQSAQVRVLSDARQAFERVTRDLRRADPLRSVGPDRISLDVRLPDTTVRTVTYERVGARLLATDAAGPTRELVDDLATGQSLFLFHMADGSTATGAEPLNPRSVRSVTVGLTVSSEVAGQVVELEDRVTVRNATR